MSATGGFLIIRSELVQLLDFIADEAVQLVLASYSQVEKLALALGRHTGRAFVNVIQ